MATQTASPRSDTPDRILSAAFRSVADLGLARTTVEDVARAAGLTRQTVYRYFASKDHLVTALVSREEERLLAGVAAAFAEAADLEAALADAIAFSLRFAREHPLLDRLLATDTETLLPLLTTRAAPLVLRARDAVLHLVRRKAWVHAGLAEPAADAIVRIVLSHMLTPTDRRSEDVARDLARIFTAALRGKEARPR